MSKHKRYSSEYKREVKSRGPADGHRRPAGLAAALFERPRDLCSCTISIACSRTSGAYPFALAIGVSAQ